MLTSPIDIIKQSTALFLRHKKTYLTYLGIFVVVSIPTLLVSSFYNPETVTGKTVGLLFLLQLIFYVVNMWLSNGLTQTSANLYHKDTTHIKQDLTHSWKRLLPAIGASILVGLAVLGGFILLFIPAIIFAVWFSFTLQAIILDSFSPIAAMKESKRLVMGRWGAVFWRIIAPVFMVIALYILIAILFSIIIGVSTVLPDIISAAFAIIASLLLWGIGILLIPVFTNYYVILYLHLKEAPLSERPHLSQEESRTEDTDTPPASL